MNNLSVSLSDSVKALIVKFIQWLGETITNITSVLYSVFPDDPFALSDISSTSFFKNVLPFINWVIPFSTIISLLLAYITACSIASTAFDTVNLIKDVINDSIDAITL
jgi:hypothetical protein